MEKYYPIFKSKSAEFKSIYRLPPNILECIVPIFDIVAKPSNITLKLHLLKIIGYFTVCINPKAVSYLDFYMLENKSHVALRFFHNKLSRKWTNIIYVVNKDTSDVFLSNLKEILRQRKNGICIRIFIEDFEDTNSIVNNLNEKLKLDYSEIDLLLDMRYLSEDSDKNEIYKNLILQINKIKNLRKFRNFILSGSSFPIDLTKLKADQIHFIERNEWSIWKKVMKNNLLQRIPAYSDYIISNPLLSQFGDTPPNASASIRYTLENQFCIYRGKGTRQYKYAQFFDLSEALIKSNEYYGSSHCEGDNFIQRCGTEKKKPGSLETWRRVGTSHHLTVTVNQILQLLRDLRK